MIWALRGAAFLLICVTAVPGLHGSQWWIRVFDFPRLQVGALIGCTLPLYGILYPEWEAADPALFGVLILALAVQCRQIVPYTPLGRKQVPDCHSLGCRVRLFNANVLMENRRADAYLQLITGRDPDVVLLIETDDWWDDATRSLGASYPWFVRVPRDNTYGMILYSQLEFCGEEVRYLADDDVPSIFVKIRLSRDQVVQLVCLHPRPPRPDKLQGTAKRDRELILVSRLVRGISGPVIVMGDLNDVAWSRTNRLFQKISDLQDPRGGRGLYSTYHAKNPLLRWPLDHIFLSRDFGHLNIARLPNCGSDHFPILYDLCIPETGSTSSDSS